MTRKQPREKRLDDIIRAALDEMLEKGYEGASMESIARRAGLSKGGLYHHFTGKDEILLTANERLDRPLRRLREKAGRGDRAGDALRDYMVRYLSYWQSHHREMVFYTLSMTKILDSQPLWRMYEQYARSYLDLFQSIFQRGIDRGEFIPHDPFQSALVTISALDGIIYYLMMDRNLELNDVLQALEKRLLDPLKREKRNPSKENEP